MDYDVIIVGGSFGGLAVASRLRGGRRVLLIDRQPIGEGQTSACAAPVVTLERMGARAAILQIHDLLVIHTARGVAVWRPGVPFAAFDYRTFCTTVLRRLAVEVKVTAALGSDGESVLTRAGRFTAPLIVDATGWRAALADSLRPGYVRPWAKGFGLETELPLTFPTGLHFYFDRHIIHRGYAWAFPAGDRTRFGVASGPGETKLRGALERFLAEQGLRVGECHGGFLASGLADPVVGSVFVVGDAAGHCLPLTGEGIRMAVRAGQFLGEQLQAVLGGVLSREEAARRYRAFVRAQRRYYAAMGAFHVALLHLAPGLVGPAAQLLSSPRPLRTLFRRYMKIFAHPDWPRAAMGGT